MMLRSMFTTLLISSGVFLHANMLVIGFIHFLMLLSTLGLMRTLDISSTDLSLVTFLHVFTQVALLFLVYRTLKWHRVEFVHREQVTAERAKTIATNLNNDFIGQVLHDLGTPITAMVLGLEEVTSRSDVAVPDDYKNVLLDVQNACAHVRSLRNRAVDFAKSLGRQQTLRPTISSVDIRKLMNAKLNTLLQRELVYEMLQNQSFKRPLTCTIWPQRTCDSRLSTLLCRSHGTFHNV